MAKATPATSRAGQMLEHAAQAGEGPDQPERHDHGEERKLTPDHAAELQQVEAGDARTAR